MALHHHLREVESMLVGHLAHEAPEAEVCELDHPPAGSAHEVPVVLAAQHVLVACLGLAERNAAHQTRPLQEVQGAVHGGRGHPLVAQGGPQVHGVEVAGQREHGLHHGATGLGDVHPLASKKPLEELPRLLDHP
ncbi:MAG: hypothetical protein NUV94_01200 [Candidatus Acetothermia bacterium]|nr:hypothetical protein [Candidatus Acetothermia bacterium]